MHIIFAITYLIIFFIPANSDATRCKMNLKYDRAFQWSIGAFLSGISTYSLCQGNYLDRLSSKIISQDTLGSIFKNSLPIISAAACVACLCKTYQTMYSYKKKIASLEQVSKYILESGLALTGIYILSRPFCYTFKKNELLGAGLTLGSLALTLNWRDQKRKEENAYTLYINLDCREIAADGSVELNLQSSKDINPENASLYPKLVLTKHFMEKYNHIPNRLILLYNNKYI